MTRRHFFGSILLGIVVGLALALVIAYVLWPVDYTNSDPSELRRVHKEDYVRLIAAEYTLDGDLPLAQQRLAALGLNSPLPFVSGLANTEPHTRTQQALARLALDIQDPRAANTQSAARRPTSTRTPARPSATPTAVPRTRTPTAVRVQPSGTPASTPSATIKPTAIATGTAIPTETPDPNAPRFALGGRESIGCGQPGEGSIQVIVRDGQGHDLPGIAVQIDGPAGSDRFYTGLKPERGIGFADYQTEPGRYSVQLIGNAKSETVVDLRIDATSDSCTGSDTVRGWKLTFQR